MGSRWESRGRRGKGGEKLNRGALEVCCCGGGGWDAKTDTSRSGGQAQLGQRCSVALLYYNLGANLDISDTR